MIGRRRQEREAEERERIASREEYDQTVREMHAAALAVPGIVATLYDEPMPPLACDYCGCLVSARGAAKHRERCAQ